MLRLSMHHHVHFHIKKILSIFFLLVTLVIISSLIKQHGIEKITLIMQTYKWLGLVLYFVYAVLCATITTFPIIPLWPFLFLIYGFWTSVFINLASSVTGASFAFLLTRKFGKTYIKKLINTKFLLEIDHIINSKNYRSFLIFRIFADSYFDIVSYAAGLSKMRYIQFVSITIVTSTLWSLINFTVIAWALTYDVVTTITILGVGYTFLAILGLIVWKLYKPK